MKSQLIYLASPYNSPDKLVMERRFMDMVRVVHEFMSRGIICYSPIVHCHPVATFGALPRSWDFWSKFDFEMISHCKEVWVIQLPGWKDSVGIKAEIEFARSRNIPVVYVEQPFGDF